MIYTDAALQSYLAGKMSDEDAGRLGEAVEQDRKLESRLMALDATAAPVASAFSMLQPPAPVALPADGRRNVLPLAASVAAALLIGGAAGWSVAQLPDAQADWVTAVADYQVLYQAETVAALSHDEAAIREQLARSSEAIGADIGGLAALQLEGRQLLRAQVLGLGERPIVQMVYQLPDGTPAALCLTRADGGESASGSEEMRVSGLTASRWQTAGLDVLLIADVEPMRMRALGETARAQLSEL